MLVSEARWRATPAKSRPRRGVAPRGGRGALGGRGKASLLADVRRGAVRRDLPRRRLDAGAKRSSRLSRERLAELPLERARSIPRRPCRSRSRRGAGRCRPTRSSRRAAPTTTRSSRSRCACAAPSPAGGSGGPRKAPSRPPRAARWRSSPPRRQSRRPSLAMAGGPTLRQVDRSGLTATRPGLYNARFHDHPGAHDPSTEEPCWRDCHLRGWIVQKRSSGKIGFLQIRDGSGIVQAVASRADISEAAWADVERVTQESTVHLTAWSRRTSAPRRASRSSSPTSASTT